MRISHGTNIKSINDANGYGYATVNMLDSLSRLGYEVNPNDATADVEIWFDQPHNWKFSKGIYKIGYHPWESTQLLPGWADIMNQCDEIWTPSPLIAKWYRDFAGITVPVYVYEHGVDPIWKPVKREVNPEVFRFLHVGGEAARKGVKESIDAFRMAFGYSKKHELNLKIISQGWNIGRLRCINIINESWPLNDLISLFHNNHAYVYPSYGEGFGLTPLQALSTGMPTITVPEWAPYADFLDPEISIPAKFTPTPWPTLHPGHMLKPSVTKTAEAMLYTYENYEAVQDAHHAQLESLMKHYDWDRLTFEAFDALENRLKNL